MLLISLIFRKMHIRSKEIPHYCQNGKQKDNKQYLLLTMWRKGNTHVPLAACKHDGKQIVVRFMESRTEVPGLGREEWGVTVFRVWSYSLRWQTVMMVGQHCECTPCYLTTYWNLLKCSILWYVYFSRIIKKKKRNTVVKSCCIAHRTQLGALWQAREVE